MILDEILTVEETANILKISISELRKLMTLRQITYFEVGEDNSKKKNKRFRRIDIENYINSHLIKDMATDMVDKVVCNE
ncbi:MAG: helix-turn-helix domain-containing protein [Bacilli bacterium]|nr:helix-turn-helix domain-containing protein [Bacilli bacterium]